MRTRYSTLSFTKFQSEISSKAIIVEDYCSSVIPARFDLSTYQSPYWNKDLVGSITNSHLPFRSAPLSVSARRPSRPRGVAEKPTLASTPVPTERLPPVATQLAALPTFPLLTLSPIPPPRYRYKPIVFLPFCLPFSP